MTNSERKRIVSTLRRAAEIVANGEQWWNVRTGGACKALFLVENIWPDAYPKFLDINGHPNKPAFWWPCDETHRTVRVMALLFAAEIVESGDWE